MAIEKAKAWENIYSEIETPGGEKTIFRIAKARDKEKKDFTQIKQMKSQDGDVLSDEKEIKERWRSYFEKLLNEETPRTFFEVGAQNEGVTSMVRRDEVKKALKKMKNGKATGPDEIPVEMWKALGEEGIDLLTDLMQKIWKEERMPDEWRNSVIIPLYKDKGDIQDCGNYRGIKLMSHTMKLLERIVDKRLREETSIRENQFGFMPGRGTTDAMFALRITMEKYREKQKGLHMVFVDLEKAYDRVPRQEVWRCMREKGVPEVYVRLVQDMYDGVQTQVRSSVGVTKKFTVKVGLHQGSALSPYLFDMIMDVTTKEVKGTPPWCMLFADDIVLCDMEREDVEQKLEDWRKVLEDRGLKISRKKTEYMKVNCNREGEIKMQGEQLKRVEKFKYLGSMVTEDCQLEAEVTHRIQVGWRNWKRTSGVLCDKRLSTRIKGKIYRSIVRPALLYGTETWPIKKSNEHRMNVAEMKMLRWAYGVTRLDKIRNENIRNEMKVTELHKKIQEKRLGWYGHLMRREEGHIGKRVLKMEVTGRRRRGRPERRWMDCVREDMKEKNLEERDVKDRNKWKTLIKNGDPA